MSQDTEELLRRWARAFNQRDFGALVDATTPDFEFTPYLANLLETTTYTGHEGLRKYFEDSDAAWEGIQIRIGQIREGPENRFFVSGELVARGRTSGADVRVSLAWAGECRDDRVASAHSYESEREALEAAGLSE